MYIKKSMILIVFILVLPIVLSQDGLFECDDGTRFGDCNENGELCIGGENLIIDNNVNLDVDKEYLFFGEINEECEYYRMVLGSKSFELTETGERVTVQFKDVEFDGEVKFFCEEREVNLDKKYIGEVGVEFGLFEDGFCKLEEFSDYAGRYINSEGEEKERLREEMRELFGKDSSFFNSLTGNVFKFFTGNVVSENICSDFSGNGVVDFDDMFLFSDSFGLGQDDEGYDTKFDLDDDNIISVEDFFIWADDFGLEVECEEEVVSENLVKCEEFLEGTTAILSCPGDGKITKISRSDFVSSSSDTSCSNEVVDEECHSYCDYEERFDCTNSNNCEFHVAYFNCGEDPCSGVKKKLVTEYECSESTIEEEIIFGEIPEKSYTFTFENWYDGEITGLINFLCGENDWIKNENVYECDFSNGNELDGSYELALEIYGELFNPNLDLKIVKKSFPGNGVGNWVSSWNSILLQPSNEFDTNLAILTHELLHSFRATIHPEVFEEGMAEAVSLIINTKLGLNRDNLFLEEYDNYNKMAIRTNDGRFYRGLFGIITKQYQLAAYAWLQLYAIDQEFFSVFNREFINRQSIDENTIRDYDKLMNIVREIFVEKDIDIDEFIDRNHVLSKADRVEITPYSHGNNFIFFIIFKNSIGRERQPNQDDFSISMKVYDFNNNLVYESPLKKFLVAFGLEGQYQWIPPDFHSVNWERGRYRYDIIAEIEGIQYISSDWISPVTNGVGIDGIVIPYSSGKVKVRIIETGEEYDLVFSNGVFHTTSNGERELRQYRGLIEIEFQSPIGETMTRRTYKLTENMFVVLNFNPLIIHNTLRETIRDVPVVISAKAYDIDGLELHYKYEGRDEYNVLDMEVTDENTFSATIPNNEEDIQSILYFIKALGSNGLISSYPEDGVNSPFLISFLDSSLDSWSPDKLVSYSLADTDAYGDPGSFWGTDLGIFACNDEGLCTRESNFHGNPFPIGLEFSSDYRNAVITLKIPSQITIAENILEMVYEEDGEVKTIRIYLPSISTTNLSFTHELFVSADGSTYWKRNDDLGIDNGVFEDAENSLARASDEKLTFGESLNNLGEVL